MNSYFFRVEHDLLRSEAFKTLGGSAIKVYLVIGLYSDFGTDWAYPSIRTIARQAGLSRQTVLAAIEKLTGWDFWRPARRKGGRPHTGSSARHPSVRRGPGRPQPGRGLDGDWSKNFRGYPGKWSKIFRGTPSKWSKIWTSRGPSRRPVRPQGWAQTRTNIKRRHSIDPDSGNAVPAHRRRPAPCCC